MQRCAFNRFLFEVQGFASPLHLQDPSSQYCVWASYWSWFWKYSLSGFFRCVFRGAHVLLWGVPIRLYHTHSFCDIALSIRHTHTHTDSQTHRGMHSKTTRVICASYTLWSLYSSLKPCMFLNMGHSKDCCNLLRFYTRFIDCTCTWTMLCTCIFPAS